MRYDTVFYFVRSIISILTYFVLRSIIILVLSYFHISVDSPIYCHACICIYRKIVYVTSRIIYLPTLSLGITLSVSHFHVLLFTSMHVIESCCNNMQHVLLSKQGERKKWSTAYIVMYNLIIITGPLYKNDLFEI